MKNKKLTLLDTHQISVNQYDEEHDAQRVTLVDIDKVQIAESIKEILKDLKPIFVKEIQVIEIEKPIVIKETEPFPKIITWLFLVQIVINLINIIFHK